MKKIILCAAILMVCSMSSLFAQFEGEIDMKITSKGDEESNEMFLQMFMKKDMMASKMNSAGKENRSAKLILRGDKKLMWIIADEEKTYIEMSLNDKKSPRTGEYLGKKKAKSGMKKTGKTQTILGYACEEWIAEDEDGISNIWATSKLGNLYEAYTKSFSKMSGMENDESMGSWGELADKKLFPLKITTSENGAVTQTQEVTKIESKSVQSSMFEPPAGYKKQSIGMDMQKMMEGMKDYGKGNKGGAKTGEGQDIDVEKMMKEMQEKMKNMRSEEDSSDDDNE